MDKKIAELIEKNSGLLRQLTSLNNEVKDLKVKVKKLEEEGSYFQRVDHVKEAMVINA